jgi:hypothetical protein
LSLVRQSKRAAEDELTLLTRDHVAQVTSALQATPAKDGPADEVFAQRQRLGSEWQQLLAERSELTRTRTDQHPQIKDIDLRMAELKKRIDALAALDKSQPQPAVNNLQDDFRSRSLELTESIAADRRREEELLAEASQLAITPAPIGLSTIIVEQPELVDRLGGQPSGFQLAVLSLLAITAGGLTYRLLRQWLAQQKLASVEEIEEQLELPVISLSAPHRSAQARRWDPIVRRSLQSAEIGLLIVSAAVFLLVATQSNLVRPVAVDPFGAVAESLDRTFSPTFRR